MSVFTSRHRHLKVRAVVARAQVRPLFRPILERLEDRWVPTNVPYGGGPLLANVKVETIYYGPNWGTDSTLQTEANNFDTFLNLITDSSYMDILSQYSVTSPTPITIGHGNFIGRDATNPALPDRKSVV